MRRLQCYLRHNAVACVALFIALGGVSYAAAALPRASVGSQQIKKNAVTSEKVKNGSLKALDFAKGELPRGGVGPKGDSGAKGDPGLTGPAGSFYRAGGRRAFGQLSQSGPGRGRGRDFGTG